MRGSIIGAGVFHFRVRDGAGWFNVASVTLKQDRNSLIRKIGMNEHLISNHELLVKKLKHFWLISSTRLKPLLALHLYPICGVVSPEPLAACAATIPNLEDGFALICLQRLSKLGFSYPAMQLTPQPVHQSPIHPGPLVLRMRPLKYRTPTADKDQHIVTLRTTSIFNRCSVAFRCESESACRHAGRTISSPQQVIEDLGV